jgi:hypothetical protein
MKNIKNTLLTLLFAAFIFPHFGAMQAPLENDLPYEVNQIYPYISITKTELKDARTLIDINKHYKSSWVKEYISVEILTTYQGKGRKSVSKNDILTQEQKDHINTADLATDISVKVLYFPDNTLKGKEIKEINFSFNPVPEKEATYFGGEEALKKYLQETAIYKIPNNRFENYDLAAVKFTIDEDGQIINVHLFQSKDEETDDLLLKAIRNMPKWQPATYENGTKGKQEFVLTVGNMENCVIHLLNINRD